MIKRVLKYIISIGLITSLSLIIYGVTGPYFNTAPLISPFTFATDDPQHFQFIADVSDTYLINIYLKKIQSDERINDILGVPLRSEERGKVNVEWYFRKDDKIVARGSNTEYRYSRFWGDNRSGLTIGEISVEKGIPYSLSLHVNNPNTDWDQLEPHIEVRMRPGILEYLIGYFIYGIILLIIFGPMALTWLLIAISNSRASNIDRE